MTHTAKCTVFNVKALCKTLSLNLPIKLPPKDDSCPLFLIMKFINVMVFSHTIHVHL